MQNLFIDIETFSGADIKKTGVYPYVENPDFEILLVGYAADNGPVITFEPADIKAMRAFLSVASKAKNLVAHNATFERLCFRQAGHDFPVWDCTMIRAAFCGLPLSLGQAGEALGLNIQKDKSGTHLIRYFCKPCKPSNANGYRRRNTSSHDPDRWEAFVRYLRKDVETTRELFYKLEPYGFTERENYIIDQKINDRGVYIHPGLVQNAIRLDDVSRTELIQEARQLTGLGNPNSLTQLQQWISERTGKEVNNLQADTVKTMEANATGEVKRVLQLRQEMSNTSVKKYQAAYHYSCRDGRARGLFQFYGAGRTGRWAGRGIQLQNLPRNYMQTLGEARSALIDGDFETLSFLYSDLQDVLKQLTRTMLTPPPGKKFVIVDFSAIEARVIAWLAGEKWRLDVFNTHGKIYEASASKMFGVPIEDVTKGSEYRQKGKIAELALGYQGGPNALIAMGSERMGLQENDLRPIVDAWRQSNPAIVRYWNGVQNAAILALKNPGKRVSRCNVTFAFYRTQKALFCYLPSGRPLVYQQPELRPGKYGEEITYMGMDQYTRKWSRLNTYGGKLTENIVQAVARDLLMHSIVRVERAGFPVVAHVHDEIICEVPEESIESDQKAITKKMILKPSWAETLPLAAEGFSSDYYLKD